jgi:hypothetical protein
MLAVLPPAARPAALSAGIERLKLVCVSGTAPHTNTQTLEAGNESFF